MQIVSSGDHLHEVSVPIFLEKNKKSISKCRLMKFYMYLSMQSVIEKYRVKRKGCEYLE